MDFSALSGLFVNVPFDIFVFGALGILLALDSLRSGIGRASAIALALPLSLGFWNLIPKTVFLKDLTILSASPMSQTITLGVLFLVTYFLIRRISLEYIESGRGEPVQSLLAGAATVAVCIVVWMQFPGNTLWPVGGTLSFIFSETYHLAWIVGSYIALAFARG